MDLIYGKGTYLFPNYKNWRLLKSVNLTYIHDLGYIRFPEFVQPKNLEFLQNGVKLWAKRSSLILTGSKHTKTEIHELLKVPLNKIVCVYHGVDTEVFYKRTRTEISSAKEKYGIEGDYIVSIGSFEPRKNLVRLIRAYRQLPNEIRNQYALFLIGGGGWLNENIHDEIIKAQDEGYKVVTPSRYVEDIDLPALISGSGLLVHPALYEGFGLPPLQAMACGVPVIASDNSSIPEVIGKAGLLFNGNDINDISAKITEVISNISLNEKMVKMGLAQAALFKWGFSAEIISKLTESVE
jgi:alpha-1,3-rhamnosyl/mannosyltransferase